LHLTLNALVYCSWTDLQRGGSNEVYTWGTNENMTLGESGAKSKSIPETVRLFFKRKLSIKQVSTLLLLLLLFFC